MHDTDDKPWGTDPPDGRSLADERRGDSEGSRESFQARAAQRASESDQSASDADQTASDTDQTFSDSDQTASDTEQAASDEDQVASDQESAAGADQRVRETGRVHRVHATHVRQEQSQARLRTGAGRDITADKRVQTASTRDRAAEMRALHATEGGGRAAAPPRPPGAEEQAFGEAGNHQRAATDRARAAVDRARAASDRARACEERAQSARDRALAAHDRAKAAIDREASEIDELTHVRRRGAGIKQLQREIDRAKRASEDLVVAFIDVDGLKQVNDSKGHLAGDALLLAVANSLRACLRSYDLIMRFGGDEFICALSHTDIGSIRQRFTDVSKALAAGSTHGSITVGFAELVDGDSPQELIHRADADLLARRER